VPTNDEDRVLEDLDDRECLRLLTTARHGWLGFTDGALPAMVPVPFALQANSLVIPARQGNWVVDAVRGSVVAFAVDSYDVDQRTGWGVTVVGPSRVVPGPVAGAPEPTGRPEEPGRCSILVRLVLLRGWRLSLPSVSPPEVTGAGAPVG
jgi:uncharacterized protein